MSDQTSPSNTVHGGAGQAARAATAAPSGTASESKLGARRDGLFMAISSAPSFNWTPLGAAMVALPYTTISDLAGSLGVANSVRFNGQPAYTMGSYQPSGKGDEAGSGGGVRSGTVNGAVKPTSASTTVKAEGKRVVREGDTNTMNGGNNTGTYVVAVRPSNVAPKDARKVSNPPIRLETPEEKSAFGRWLDHVGERLRLAREHPLEALKGAAKGIVNIVPNLVETMAKGSAEQQAMDLEQAAMLQQVLGRPHAAKAFLEGATASRQAGADVAVPKMAMSNSAQEGGDLVATGLQLFAGGVGLAKGVVKSIGAADGMRVSGINSALARASAVKPAVGANGYVTVNPLMPGRPPLSIEMSNQPGSVVRNAMSDAEYAQAQEIVGFKGGNFEGAPTSNFPGIDGWLDGTPVQLKNVTGKSLSAIQRNIVGGAADMEKQGYIGDLYIDTSSTGVGMEQLTRFAKPGSPISNVLNEGTVNNVYVKTPDGWLNFAKGTIVTKPGG